MSQNENKLSSSYKMIYLYSFRPFANKTSQYSTYVEGPGNFWGREGIYFARISTNLLENFCATNFPPMNFV